MQIKAFIGVFNNAAMHNKKAVEKPEIGPDRFPSPITARVDVKHQVKHQVKQRVTLENFSVLMRFRKLGFYFPSSHVYN